MHLVCFSMARNAIPMKRSDDLAQSYVHDLPLHVLVVATTVRPTVCSIISITWHGWNLNNRSMIVTFRSVTDDALSALIVNCLRLCKLRKWSKGSGLVWVYIQRYHVADSGARWVLIRSLFTERNSTTDCIGLFVKLQYVDFTIFANSG